MTGIIVTIPPGVELPPGQASGGVSPLPGVTHTFALPGVPQTWTAPQTFGDNNLIINGAVSGNLTLRATPDSGFSAIRFPAGSTDFTATGGASQVVQQSSIGGAFTVGQLAFANISGNLPATQLPALTGDVTTTVGTVATTIAANAVTNAKAAKMAANTIKGNNTGALANAADLTGDAVEQMLLFTQSGTGAVQRSLDAKVKEVVSVKDFGAVGSGVADDTAAIVAAVTYLNSIGGGRLLFPRGTYLVSSSMVFSSFRNITCQGEGVDATIIKAWSGGTFTNGLFSYSGGAYLKHSGITFDVNNKSVGTLLPAIFFVSATDIEVSDCEVLHMSTIGIGTTTCSNIRILRNKITLDVAFNSQNNGILISGNSNDVWIDSNELSKTGMLLAATNCWVTNNNCHDYKYGGGIGCTGNVAGQSGPYYVIGNTCSGGVGIDTDGTYVAGMEFNGIGGICANNTCFNNSGVGIASFSFGSAITGNVCYNNGTGASVLHCAGILGAFQAAGQFFGNNVVSGNTCYDTGGATQLYGYQDVTDTRCAGNTFAANNFDHNATSPVSMAATNSYQGATYSGILAYAGGTVTSGTSATFNVTVPNSNLGDFAIGSLDSYAGGAAISAKAIGSSLVAVTVSNLTGSTATLPAGNFTAMVIKHQ